ncbi:hypothetical protein MKX01_007291 [Papaver californicum]|nr:hypothetical protein MKX01_007291 [Papaver californicum]
MLDRCIYFSHSTFAEIRLCKVQEAASGSMFSQMVEVWINLAHVYFAQGKIALAVKMGSYLLFQCFKLRKFLYYRSHGSRNVGFLRGIWSSTDALGYINALIEEHIHGFKVNIKQDKKLKFSSIVLKLQGIEQETWRQHVTGGKLREITEEAKSFTIGNKGILALFVHTPASELQSQIRAWLAENFKFLSVTGGDGMSGTAGQLELLSKVIMDGWMAGLGAALPHNTNALGQLLSEYSKRVYISQLQHMKDIAGTFAT